MRNGNDDPMLYTKKTIELSNSVKLCYTLARKTLLYILTVDPKPRLTIPDVFLFCILNPNLSVSENPTISDYTNNVILYLREHHNAIRDVNKDALNRYCNWTSASLIKRKDETDAMLDTLHLCWYVLLAKYEMTWDSDATFYNVDMDRARIPGSAEPTVLYPALISKDANNNIICSVKGTKTK